MLLFISAMINVFFKPGVHKKINKDKMYHVLLEVRPTPTIADNISLLPANPPLLVAPLSPLWPHQALCEVSDTPGLYLRHQAPDKLAGWRCSHEVTDTLQQVVWGVSTSVCAVRTRHKVITLTWPLTRCLSESLSPSHFYVRVLGPWVSKVAGWWRVDAILG